MGQSSYRRRSAGRSAPGRLRSAAGSPGARRGTAAVEFAIVAPVIFLFVFAGFEFGRVLMVVHGLEAAAREGCRIAISWDTTQQEVEQAVAQRLSDFGIGGYDLTLQPEPPSSACQWEPITVRIAVEYANVSWLPLPGFLRDITLTGSCTLPQESDQCDS